MSKSPLSPKPSGSPWCFPPKTTAIYRRRLIVLTMLCAVTVVLVGCAAALRGLHGPTLLSAACCVAAVGLFAFRFCRRWPNDPYGIPSSAEFMFHQVAPSAITALCLVAIIALGMLAVAVQF